MKELAVLGSGVCLLAALGCGAQEPTLGQPNVLQAQKVAGGITFEEGFGKHWSDGRAEVASYELTTPRYGELRQGVAVTIFVKEVFSAAERVKAETHTGAREGQYPVMKLNLIEDFQTGIYDYNVMLSSFVALKPLGKRPTGSPSKASFSAQEWCGHVYHQLLFNEDTIQEDLHSYFEGEADASRQLPYPEDGLSEDFLLFWARGMALPGLAPGEKKKVPLLLSLKTARFSHVPLAWREAELSRSLESEELSVPAGTFQVEVFSAKVEGGESHTFWVEKAFPHRIIKWEKSNGERAVLIASERIKYWELNGEGMESHLEKLGLSRRPPRAP